MLATFVDPTDARNVRVLAPITAPVDAVKFAHVLETSHRSRPTILNAAGS
jgi:hypothetical protein